MTFILPDPVLRAGHDMLLFFWCAAHILWWVHRAVVQPGEELSSLPHCDHREGLQMEGRSNISAPADLLIDKVQVVASVCVCVCVCGTLVLGCTTPIPKSQDAV